jgi:hypothetical protein
MTDIYIEISKLTDKFRKIGLWLLLMMKTKVNEAVQEINGVFFANESRYFKEIFTLRTVLMGVTKYGAVALRRALTSPRSNFYYKYQKYYDTHN